MNRNYADAAAELGCSEAWLREHTPKRPLPHLKFGRSNGPVVFTDAHIDQIRAMFEVAPLPAPAVDDFRPLPTRRRIAS